MIIQAVRNWNVGKLLPDYAAQQPRRQSSSHSPPWEPEISHSILTCIFLFFGSLIRLIYTCKELENSLQFRNGKKMFCTELVYGNSFPPKSATKCTKLYVSCLVFSYNTHTVAWLSRLSFAANTSKKGIVVKKTTLIQATESKLLWYNAYVNNIYYPHRRQLVKNVRIVNLSMGHVIRDEPKSTGSLLFVGAQLPFHRFSFKNFSATRENRSLFIAARGLK
jgi:hypothetical protein